MFYNIKKRIIQSAISKRKQARPFDEKACELFTIKPDDPHEINNSFFLGAHTSAGEDITLRMGMRNGDEHELFVIIRTAEGRVLRMEKDHYNPEEMPVKVTCEEVSKKWRYTFDGTLVDITAAPMEGLGEHKGDPIYSEGARVKASFDLLFTATLPIYDFMQTPETHDGMTSSIARAKWNGAFWKSLGASSQRHYEQTGRISGSLTIDGETRTIDWPAVRDRAIGRRIWNDMDCHIWLNCTTDKGEALTFSLVSYPFIKSLFSGYTNIGRKENVSLTDCAIMCYEHNDRKGTDRIKVYTSWSDGRKMFVDATRDTNVYCTFDHGDYIFQEGLGTFYVNGAEARGNIEYGYNKDAARIKDYKTINF